MKIYPRGYSLRLKNVKVYQINEKYAIQNVIVAAQNALDQESKIQEKNDNDQKERREEMKNATGVKHLASFYRYIQFGRVDI